jgi:UDP-N-acetylglucosamine diphosphorylase/glucosamine-1-phosphate N-acetyltransferase
MHIIFFDDTDKHESLKPFTYTRPIAELRVGIVTIKEKWLKRLDETSYAFQTKDYLQGKYPLNEKETNLFINGSICPNDYLIEKVLNLPKNGLLQDNEGRIIAYMASSYNQTKDFDRVELDATNYNQLSHPWDIFRLNGEEMEADFELLTKGRISQPLSDTNQVINPERVFLEKGAKVECSILNASTGPIYLGENSEIMEGSVVRGGLALCAHATLKLSAKIYGPTTVGPHSKVGGEVGNSVILGYSNKGHDGYLGNSVLGEWCNLGADTNNSNLKNNYSQVRVWSYEQEEQTNSNLQFCGLLMGDHSKSGINTMFNTGTVVGVCANIYGGGFPKKFIPSFSWGGSDGFVEFKIEKAFEVAERVMERRSIPFTKEDEKILKHIFQVSEKYRS